MLQCGECVVINIQSTLGNYSGAGHNDECNLKDNKKVPYILFMHLKSYCFKPQIIIIC